MNHITSIQADPLCVADKLPETRRNKHFEDRCIERGIVETDGHLLWRELCWAIANKRDDLVEFCKATDKADYWRFRCKEGVFYAVVKAGRNDPCTVYDQAAYRQQCRREKARRGGSQRTRKKPPKGRS